MEFLQGLTQGILLLLLLILPFGSSESMTLGKGHGLHLDEGRSSSFSPSTSNSHGISIGGGNGGGGGVGSSPSASNTIRVSTPIVYAQSRDSYAQAAAANSAGYNTLSSGGLGTTGLGSAGLSSSYMAPAAVTGSSGGYGTTPGQQSMTYYYYHYPAQQAGGYGDSTGYQDQDDGGFDGAGLGGLAGLLGLKGLKGLGGLGLLALLKLLKPFLLPLLLPFLLFLPLLLLFIPIPVITIPAQGRTMSTASTTNTLGSYVSDFVSERMYRSAELATDVLTSGLCVERISCELSRKAHGTYWDKLITQVFEKSETYSSKKWKRAMRAYIESGFNSDGSSEPRGSSSPSCSKYICDPYKELMSRFSLPTIFASAYQPGHHQFLPPPPLPPYPSFHRRVTSPVTTTSSSTPDPSFPLLKFENDTGETKRPGEFEKISFSNGTTNRENSTMTSSSTSTSTTVSTYPLPPVLNSIPTRTRDNSNETTLVYSEPVSSSGGGGNQEEDGGNSPDSRPIFSGWVTSKE